MKQSGLVRRQEAAKKAVHGTSHVAAAIYRAGLSELLDAKDGEDLRVAFHRAIDERIAYNRWYRRLWRWVARFPLDT